MKLKPPTDHYVFSNIRALLENLGEDCELQYALGEAIGLEGREHGAKRDELYNALLDALQTFYTKYHIRMALSFKSPNWSGGAYEAQEAQVAEYTRKADALRRAGKLAERLLENQHVKELEKLLVDTGVLDGTQEVGTQTLKSPRECLDEIVKAAQNIVAPLPPTAETWWEGNDKDPVLCEMMGKKGRQRPRKCHAEFEEFVEKILAAIKAAGYEGSGVQQRGRHGNRTYTGPVLDILQILLQAVPDGTLPDIQFPDQVSKGEQSISAATIYALVKTLKQQKSAAPADILYRKW